MEDNTYIKLFRRLSHNDIIKDSNALQLFIWLLINVDRKTGSKKVARSWACQELGMKSTTFYDSLQRIVKKYKMATARPTANYTIISLINWQKYQQADRLPDSNPTATRQQPDTLQEERREKRESVVAPQPRPNNNSSLGELVTYLEEKTGAKIISWGKQAKAVSIMTKAGYSINQIKWAIDQMGKDAYYDDKGFDLMTVANQLPRFKQIAEKRKGVLATYEQIKGRIKDQFSDREETGV